MPANRSAAGRVLSSGIVLAGNPNVGKSVVFGWLTGQYVEVSNYPGTTVEVLTGRFGDHTVVDTPGVYGLSSFNDEERIARDAVLSADVVVNVVNGARLQQDLFLTLQLIDADLPVVVALNMMDEARALGISINPEELSRALGVEVIPCIAVRGEGLNELRAAVGKARRGHRDPVLSAELVRRYPGIPTPAALLAYESDPETAARYRISPGNAREESYRRRRERVDTLCRRVVHETRRGARLGVRLGRLAVRPITGLPILAAVLALMFYVLGVAVAGHLVGFTEGTMFEGLYIPFVQRLLSGVLRPGSAAGRLLAGEFGVLTMGITYLFGLLLPLVVAFHLMMAVLEDSGYLPRMAVLADRVLTRIGLNGRAIIPIILGFGCVTMATVTTRLLGTRRERFIATLLLGLAIPCSAQFGVIVGMVAPLGAGYIVFYLATIALVFGFAGLALNRVLPGESSPLLIELPPMRLPRAANVLTKTWHKSRHFIVETAPVFLVGSLLIGVVDLTGILDRVYLFTRPLISGWLGLPAQTATAFIMGLLRRDFGAAGLTSIPMSSPQTLVALITMTLFVPCVASMMMIWRERGWREGLLVWFGSFGAAFAVGGIVARILI